MDTVLLVFASLAALVFGVVAAYGACVMLFALVRIQATQQPTPTPTPANGSPEPIGV